MPALRLRPTQPPCGPSCPAVAGGVQGPGGQYRGTSSRGGFNRLTQHLDLGGVVVSQSGRPAIPVAVQREFWAAVRSGMVIAEAAAVVGVSITVAWRWFRHVGGVMPDPFPASTVVAGGLPQSLSS